MKRSHAKPQRRDERTAKRSPECARSRTVFRYASADSCSVRAGGAGLCVVHAGKTSGPRSPRSWCCRWKTSPAIRREEYFADGMTDALIGDLAKIGGLHVISRTSSMHYKGTKKSLPRDRGRDQRRRSRRRNGATFGRSRGHSCAVDPCGHRSAPVGARLHARHARRSRSCRVRSRRPSRAKCRFS